MIQLQKTKISILTFHSIDDNNSVISTDVNKFRWQMKFLKENDFNVISLKSFDEYLQLNMEIPPKTIILTFDDGFQNFYIEAFPILNEYNFTATVFLITDYCGKLNDWAGNSTRLKPIKLMDWKEIEELSRYGINFGAHTKTHPNLTKISLEDAEKEIIESKLEIEKRLGIEITDFAYPYGNFNGDIKRITQKYYQTACSTNLGKVGLDDDFFSLKRLDSYYLSNERIFNSLSTTKFDFYIGIRQILRRIKSTWYS